MLSFAMPVRFKDLPKICAVYFVTTDNEVLYIGQTINLQNRINSHHCKRRFVDYGATRLLVFPFDLQDRLNAMQAERTLIQMFKPICNGGFHTMLTRGLV